MSSVSNIKNDGPLNGYAKGGGAVDEREALKKLKRKNESALEWFIDRYAAYVNTIIYNIIGSSMSSSDIEEVYRCYLCLFIFQTLRLLCTCCYICQESNL